jgi:hypothetical protein
VLCVVSPLTAAHGRALRVKGHPFAGSRVVAVSTIRWSKEERCPSDEGDCLLPPRRTRNKTFGHETAGRSVQAASVPDRLERALSPRNKVMVTVASRVLHQNACSNIWRRVEGVPGAAPGRWLPGRWLPGRSSVRRRGTASTGAGRTDPGRAVRSSSSPSSQRCRQQELDDKLTGGAHGSRPGSLLICKASEYEIFMLWC